MQLPTIAAIDPSLTSTGICWGTGQDDYQVVCCGTRPGGLSVMDRVRRYESLVGQIERVLSVAKPVMIFIEEYAYSKNTGGQMYLGEFGGLLRWHLVDHTPHIYEVTASGLKKFVTGKGNSKKELVMAHVVQRWNKIFATSDEADAFVMYQMALVAAGRGAACNAGQRESVAKVISDHSVSAEQLRAVCSGVPVEKPF